MATQNEDWTDRSALALAVYRAQSRGEAIAVVATWGAVEIGKRAPTAADRFTAEQSRILSLACVPGPPRKRPDHRDDGPLFRRPR